MTVESIGIKIAAYEELRRKAEEMKAELEALNKEKDADEADVIAAILDAQEQTGVDGLGVSYEGRKYSVAVKNYYSIPKLKRDAAFEQMRCLGMGDLIQERVDDRTLTKELDGVFEENGGVFPPEYLPLFDNLTRYGKSALRRVKEG